MVSIERYSDAWESEASQLEVKPEQAEFTVGKVLDVVSQLNQHEHPHLIFLDDSVVGFFILDLGYSEAYEFSSSEAIGVRALMVDQRYQGKGIASTAISLLPEFIRKNHPESKMIQLTVNCRNKAAYECYLKCGFQDTGELYLGGPAGPQHIMQRSVA